MWDLYFSCPPSCHGNPQGPQGASTPRARQVTYIQHRNCLEVNVLDLKGFHVEMRR
jgi:hypothetical protein